MITIKLQKLHVPAIIGVWQYERCKPQNLFLNLELEVGIDLNTVNDDLGNTLDYDALSKAVIEFVKTSQYLLLETLVEQVGQLILETDHRIRKVVVEIEKPDAVPEAQHVSMTASFDRLKRNRA